MSKLTLRIQNKLGLHARAAAKFVTLASQFNSDVFINYKQTQVNGKSIMGVMMLAAAKGAEITLIINGEDELNAMAVLQALINDRFGEELDSVQ